MLEHVGHHPHVEDPGHVAEDMTARGQQGGHHLLEDGVLGAQHRNRAMEGTPADEADLVHQAGDVTARGADIRFQPPDPATSVAEEVIASACSAQVELGARTSTAIPRLPSVGTSRNHIRPSL